MSTKYVLVEVTTTVPDDAIPELDSAIAKKIRRALGHHYHNSPRSFRTADVTEWVEAVDGDLYLDTPRLDLA